MTRRRVVESSRRGGPRPSGDEPMSMKKPTIHTDPVKGKTVLVHGRAPSTKAVTDAGAGTTKASGPQPVSPSGRTRVPFGDRDAAVVA